MALCKSYNVDVSGNKVGLESSGCDDDGTDQKVLRVLILENHGEYSYKGSKVHCFRGRMCGRFITTHRDV
jgi:hypothetical protein